ncbi:MAG: GNAT family N-acetyltransferase [Acidobacteria bacterium]|nr:GNAT family N-acetyltransferase [Acidobacteriota bacterium]
MKITRGGLDDPRVQALLAHHVRTARAETAPGSAHALDLTALKSPDVTFWSAWKDDSVVGVGALKRLSPTHGEIKSMHTAEAQRRAGVGAAILRHIIDSAQDIGMTRLSLETGSWAYFDPARALYRRHGFGECPPFGEYVEDPHSVFMTLPLTRGPSATGFVKYIVRSARAGDASAACEVVRRSISELCGDDHHGDGDVVARWLANKTAVNCESWIRSEHNVALVAERESVIVGFGLMNVVEASIRMLYVAPEVRFQGVSKALLHRLEAEARQRRIAELRLESTATAQRLYASCGYVSDGDGAPASGLIARSYQMRKRISSGL